ncbi:hypothetical protein F4803DRAFT_568115 [Xylaria telfairii]|nr:hypothetical protein F4803DRAFT_568115 [Xylaria telfairii]
MGSQNSFWGSPYKTIGNFMNNVIGSMFRSTNPEDPWFRPKLRTKDYESFGDAYDDGRNETIREPWKVTDPKPYLEYVQKISHDWIQFRLLRDFMEIGADPQKWPDLSDPGSATSNSRSERIQRTKVRVLDYFSNEVVENKAGNINSARDLQQFLEKDAEGIADDHRFRLYVVEDLSRDVIEALGSKFNIEADVFRSHIVDYAWYNVRDRWRDPPVLSIVGQHQNWIQLRYVTVRYFSPTTFDNGNEQAERFNIGRRVDEDLCKAWWDQEGAKIGLTRSRATYWVSPKRPNSRCRIGVLLLDPTVKAGVPLWRGRRNCQTVPTPKEFASRQIRTSGEQNAIFEDFVHWASNPKAFSNIVAGSGESDHHHHAPIQVLLHLICSEWLTILDYIKTRLAQIDMEIIKPHSFATGQDAGATLEKLHMWRRFIPLYREMVTETLRRVFNYSSIKVEMSAAGRDISSTTLSALGKEEGGDPQGVPPRVTTYTPIESNLSQGDSLGLPRLPQPKPSSISIYERDLLIILEQLEEYQQRVDRLTSVVTAVMSIEDSRRGLRDNHNIGRLTALATGFIPFSLIAGIFSMQADLGDLFRHHTLQIFFETAIPLLVVVVLVVTVLQKPNIRKGLLWIAKSLITAARFGRRKAEDDSAV